MLCVLLLCAASKYPTATIGDSLRYELLDYTVDGFAQSKEALEVGWELNINASVQNNILLDKDVTVATPRNTTFDDASDAYMYGPPSNWHAVDPSTVEYCVDPGDKSGCYAKPYNSFGACISDAQANLCSSNDYLVWVANIKTVYGCTKSCASKTYVFQKNNAVASPTTFDAAALQPYLLNSKYARKNGAPTAERCAGACRQPECSAWQFDEFCTLIMINQSDYKLLVYETSTPNITEMMRRGYDLYKASANTVNKAYAAKQYQEGGAVPPLWTMLPQDINAAEQNIPIAWASMYNLGVNIHFDTYEDSNLFEGWENNVFKYFPQPYAYQDEQSDILLTNCPVLPPRRLLGAIYNWFTNNATPPVVARRSPYLGDHAVDVFSFDNSSRCPIYGRFGATPTYTKGTGCVAPNGNRTAAQSIVELCNTDTLYTDEKNVVRCRFAPCNIDGICLLWNNALDINNPAAPASDPFQCSTAGHAFQKSIKSGLYSCITPEYPVLVALFNQTKECDQAPFTYTELAKTIVSPWCLKTQFSDAYWVYKTRDAQRMCFQNLTDAMTVVPESNNDVVDPRPDKYINALRNTPNPQAVYTHFRNLRRAVEQVTAQVPNVTRNQRRAQVPRYPSGPGDPDDKLTLFAPYSKASNAQPNYMFAYGIPTAKVDGWSFYDAKDFVYFAAEGQEISPSVKDAKIIVPVLEGAKGADICSSGSVDALCNWRKLSDLAYPIVQGYNTSNIAESLDMFCALQNYNIMFGSNINYTKLSQMSYTDLEAAFGGAPTTLSYATSRAMWAAQSVAPAFATQTITNYQTQQVWPTPYGRIGNWISASLACPGWKTDDQALALSVPPSFNLALPEEQLETETAVHTLKRNSQPALSFDKHTGSLQNPRFTSLENAWFYTHMTWLTATEKGFLSQEPAAPPPSSIGGIRDGSEIKTGPRRGMATASTPISITPSARTCNKYTNDAECINARCVWWQPLQQPQDPNTYCGSGAQGASTSQAQSTCIDSLTQVCPVCANKSDACVSCSDKVTPQTCDTPQYNTSLAACAWDYVNRLCVHVPLWREARQKGGLFPANTQGMQMELPTYIYTDTGNYPPDTLKNYFYSGPGSYPQSVHYGPAMQQDSQDLFNPAINTRFTNSKKYSPYTVANQTMPFFTLYPSSTMSPQIEFPAEYDGSACGSADCGDSNFHFVHKVFDENDLLTTVVQSGIRLNEMLIYSGCYLGTLALLDNNLHKWESMYAEFTSNASYTFPKDFKVRDFLFLMVDIIIKYGPLPEDNLCGSEREEIYNQQPNVLVQPGLYNNDKNLQKPMYFSNLRGFATDVLLPTDTLDKLDHYMGTLADIYIDTGCAYGPVASYANSQFGFTSNTALQTVFDDAFALCNDLKRRELCCGSPDCKPVCVKMTQMVPFAHPILYGGKGRIDLSTPVCNNGSNLVWFNEGVACITDSTEPISFSTALYTRKSSNAASFFNPPTWISRDQTQTLLASDAPSPSNIIGVPGHLPDTLKFVKGTALHSFASNTFEAPNATDFMKLNTEPETGVIIADNYLSLNDCWHACAVNVACTFCAQTPGASTFRSGYYAETGNVVVVFNRYELEPFNISERAYYAAPYAPINGIANFQQAVNASIDECNRMSSFRLFGYQKNTCFLNPGVPTATNFKGIIAYRQLGKTNDEVICNLDVTPRCTDKNPVTFKDVYNTAQAQSGYLLLDGNNDNFFLAGMRYVPMYAKKLPASSLDNVTLYFEDLQMCGFVNKGAWHALPSPCQICSSSNCQVLSELAYSYYFKNLQNVSVETLPMQFDTYTISSKSDCSRPCISGQFVIQVVNENQNQYCFASISEYLTFKSECTFTPSAANNEVYYTQPLSNSDYAQYIYTQKQETTLPNLLSVQNTFGALTYTYNNYGYSKGVACQCSSPCASSVGLQFMAMLPMLKEKDELPSCDLETQAGFVSETNFTVTGFLETSSISKSSMQECVKTCAMQKSDAVRFSASKQCTCYTNPLGRVDYYAMTSRPQCTASNCDRRAGCTLQGVECVRTKTEGDLEMPLPMFQFSQAQVFSKSKETKTNIYWQTDANLTDITLTKYKVGTVPSSLLSQPYQATNAPELNYPVPILSAGAAPTAFTDAFTRTIKPLA